MRLTVVFSERTSCYVALHSSDVSALFSSLGTSRHFCRPLRLDRTERRDKEGVPRVYAGWVGDAALAKGTLEVSPPFAACLGLSEGEIVTGSAVTDAAVAPSVMVQPHSVDDWEVVELQAGFIEEHLLAQVAVLTPGMAFTVWIHGQMPVKLRVDPNDANTAECFLLDRNTELIVESRRRATDAGEKPYALFGRSKGGGSDPKVRLRVLIQAAPDGATSVAFDAPFGHLHPEDLQRLAGRAAPESCLVWLRTRSKTQSAPVASGPRLFRVEANAAVPRGHLIIGACQAECAHLPCFSLARVWRCRQVPVYVPRIELVPLKPCASEQDSCHISEEDSAWLSRLFHNFVTRCGEIDLMDGAVVQLRSQADGEVSKDKAAAQDNSPGKDEPKQASSASESTDLYEGLSDIDDVYQSGPTFGVTSSAHNVLEVDLALDMPPPPPAAWSGGCEVGMQPPPSARRPGALPVSIRFVLGATRENLQGAQTPPFVRLTPGSLASDVTVTARQPDKIADADLAGGQNSKVGVEASSRSPQDTLEQLWTAVPHLHLPSEEDWSEVVQLVTEEESSTLLDGLKLIEEPAASLRRHLLAQLGCPATGKPEEPELDPLGDFLPGFAVPGATAVVGPLGTGKTMLCRRVLAELRSKGVLPLEVACAKLGQPSRKFKAVQEWLGAVFRVACWYSPSAILLDDLGALCPDVEQGAVSLSVTEERSIFLAEMLLDLLPEVRACGARVALVATLPDQSAIHRVLWSFPAMEHKVPMRSPQLKERPEILQLLCKQQQHSGFDVDESLCREGALDEWGGQVDGFSIADLARLVERATIEATLEAGAGLLRSEGGPGWNDSQHFALRHLERACRDFVPATLGDQTFFTSDVHLSDVGGLQGPKQALMDMLLMPTKYGVLLDRAPVRPRRGLMLVGPPGCGKTMLVHAAASETRGLLRFLTVKGPELLSKYIGASEAGVRQVFERAAAAAPSVLFFDEIEALAPKRGGDSTGVTDRVVNQMLCYLDGVEDRGRVFVVAATGRPDLVDAALMRPGRFDKICYCGIPSDEERLQICEILAKKHGLVVGSARQQVHGTELRSHLQTLVSQLPRLFTCADLNALFSSAKIEAVNEALRVELREPEGTAHRRPPAVALDHLFAALASAKASISEADDRRYTRLFAAYRPGTQQSALRRDGSESQSAGIKVALA